MSRVHNSFYCFPERRAVAGNICFNSEIFSCKKDRASMSSDISGHDNRISRLRKCSANIYSVFNLSHSGRCDKNTIHLSFSGYFGVSGHDMYTCFCRRFFHRRNDFFQFFHRKSLFDNKCTGQIEWFCTHAGKIIDCSTDRKFTNISSLKECR